MNDRAQVSGRGILVLVVGLLIAGVLFGPFVTTINENTGTQSVTNETVTAGIGETFDLQGYEIDGSTVDVRVENQSDGSFESATEGTDYELDPGAGTITILNSSQVDSGDEIRISYDYQATGSTTTTVLTLSPLLLALLLIVPLSNKIQELL